MTTIWKFTLALTDHQELLMPKDAQILTVQMQDEKPCLWALVDTKAKKEPRIIEIIGTGNPTTTQADAERLFIASVQERGFVWHVFELCQP